VRFRVKLFICFVLVGTVAAIGVGCGGDDNGGGSDSSGEAQPVALATSSTGQAYVGQFHAADLFGDKFGLASDNSVEEFEDETAAAQLLVAGRADVESSGMTQVIQLIEKDQDVKAFCPIQIDSTEQLVGLTDKITSLDQITDPDIRVAVDSPGGLVNFIMNLLFQEKGIDITTSDLQNVTVLGDGSQRLAALAANQVDVGSVDLFELPDLQKQIGKDAVTTLSVTAADTDFVANVYLAKSDWLDANTDLAGAYCATTLYSNRILASDFDQYKDAVNQYVEGGVDDSIIKTNWDFARKYNIWPYNVDVLSPEAVKTIIDVGIPSKLLDESARDYTFDDIVDTRPGDIAMDMLGGPVTPEQVKAGDIPEPKAN
jgi:hypothetical protein